MTGQMGTFHALEVIDKETLYLLCFFCLAEEVIIEILRVHHVKEQIISNTQLISHHLQQ